jgi:hypothetical protein
MSYVNRAQQERQERYEEERRRRDQISLDNIATLTVERRTQSNNRGRGTHGFGRGSRGGRRGRGGGHSQPTASRTIDNQMTAPQAQEQTARSGLFGNGGNDAVHADTPTTLRTSKANDSSSTTPGNHVPIARRGQGGPQPSRVFSSMTLPTRGRRWADL